MDREINSSCHILAKFICHKCPSSFDSYSTVSFISAAQVSSIPIVDDNDSLLDIYSRR